MPHFELTILGTSSSQPSHGRFPSSQVLQCGNNLYLIDCGEGCQMQLTKYQVKRSKIKGIFISHMHGDHIFGIPGVITSFMHFSRKDKLVVIGPIGIKKFIDAVLSSSFSYLGFELEIREWDTTNHEKIFSDNKIDVFSIPLKHNIPTMGFRFSEIVNYRRLDKNFIQQYHLSHQAMKQLKEGKSVTLEDGRTILADEACMPINKGVSYAYLSDTMYDEKIVPYIMQSHTIYHETTYLNAMADQARERMHSTTFDAANIALHANVGHLLIGHYSSRYKDIEVFEKECQSIFPNTSNTSEGMQIIIK